jgi:hypothetical protein
LPHHPINIDSNIGSFHTYTLENSSGNNYSFQIKISNPADNALITALKQSDSKHACEFREGQYIIPKKSTCDFTLQFRGNEDTTRTIKHVTITIPYGETKDHGHVIKNSKTSYKVDLPKWVTTNGPPTLGSGCSVAGSSIQQSLIVSPVDGKVLAATDDNDGCLGGVFSYNVTTSTWSNISGDSSTVGTRGIAVVANGPQTGRIYIGKDDSTTTSGGPWYSDNNGVNWTQQNNGLTNLRMRALAVVPSSNPNNYYDLYSGSNLNGTLQGGISNLVYTGSSGYYWNLAQPLVYSRSITLDGNNGMLYVGTEDSFYNGGVWFANTNTSGNLDWDFSNYGMGSRNVYSVAVSCNSAVYAGTYDNTTNGDGLVFKSTTRGRTWEEVGDTESGLPGSDIYAVSIVEVNDDCNDQSYDIYAGTKSNGVYKSTDGGYSWYAVNKGLGSPTESLDVRSLAIKTLSSGDYTVFNGTSGAGVYQLQ